MPWDSDHVERTFSKDKRISAKQAEYMELQGAQKDNDCEEVRVQGGVSSQLGCCDKFKPRDPAVQQFRCGTCKYLKYAVDAQAGQAAPQQGQPAY